MVPKSVVTTARKTITTAHASGSHTRHREADATNRKRRDSMSGMPNRKTTIGTYHDFLQRTSHRCPATAQSWLTKDKKTTSMMSRNSKNTNLHQLSENKYRFWVGAAVYERVKNLAKCMQILSKTHPSYPPATHKTT